MELDKARILSRTMAREALTDDEIDHVSGGGPYTGLSIGNYCWTAHGQYRYQDDCAAD